MLGCRVSEREESVNSNHARRPENVNSNLFGNNEETLSLNPREAELGVNAELERNSAIANSSADSNRLSSELNSRISREKDEMMNSVSVQIQRAINDAISSQVLPQIQNVLTAGSGHMPQKGWNVSAEEPEIDPEVLRSENSKNNLKSERVRNRLSDEPMDNAYDMVTGENGSPNQKAKFLSFSRDECHQEVISTNPTMTSIPYLTRRSQRKRELHRRSTQIQIADWLVS